MRLNHKQPSVSRTAQRPAPGLTFNNSLLAWHARRKAECAAAARCVERGETARAPRAELRASLPAVSLS